MPEIILQKSTAGACRATVIVKVPGEQGGYCIGMVERLNKVPGRPWYPRSSNFFVFGAGRFDTPEEAATELAYLWLDDLRRRECAAAFIRQANDARKFRTEVRR